MSDIAVVGCCCCSAWLGLGDLCVSVTLTAREYRSSMQYKIAALSYKVLHDTAPRYLGPLTRVVDIPGRRALRSACTDRLEVPYFKLSTIGG